MLKFTIKSNLLYKHLTSAKYFAEKLKIRKDYYQILGISKTATEEEIKTAYRALAKRFHPDVNIGEEKHEPNVEKFRDIAEAYAVLSNKTMRLDYDMRLKQYPDMIYNAEKMKNMEENKPERDLAGNKVKPSPLKGSYAEYRLEKLKEWRKKFDVDNHGFYKGGVPRRNGGATRGNAWAPPGVFHSPFYHNEEVHDNPHARPHVAMKEAQDHRRFMNASRSNYQRFRPYYKMDEIEQDSQYYVDSEHRVLFWIPMILLGSIATYFLYQRISQARRYNNLESKIENMRAYEYIKQGPVILLANDFKFTNKYQSREEYHKWIDNDLRTFG